MLEHVRFFQLLLNLPRRSQTTSMRSAGSVNNHPNSRAVVESFIQTQTQATSIPSHLDSWKSPKEWSQSAGKDISFDTLNSTASFSAAEDVLDVESVRRVLSAIRKVMEGLKTDASQILPADEAAGRLHTIFDLVFSSKRSCKTLLNFQGDDAKIVLNSLQWVSSFSSSNLCSRWPRSKVTRLPTIELHPKEQAAFGFALSIPQKWVLPRVYHPKRHCAWRRLCRCLGAFWGGLEGEVSRSTSLSQGRQDL